MVKIIVMNTPVKRENHEDKKINTIVILKRRALNVLKK